MRALHVTRYFPEINLRDFRVERVLRKPLRQRESPLHQFAKMGRQGSLPEDGNRLTLDKQATDTAADTRQPAMERKAGQKEEVSWEDHSKEARTVQEAAGYEACVQSTLRI